MSYCNGPIQAWWHYGQLRSGVTKKGLQLATKGLAYPHATAFTQNVSFGPLTPQLLPQYVATPCCDP